MTDLVTGTVKSIAPKFKAHLLEIVIIVASFILATGHVLMLLAGWPVRNAVIAGAVFIGSFSYAAIRKWNVEGWPEWTAPFIGIGGFFSAFVGWWLMPLKDNPEKRGLIISGRVVVGTCAVLIVLAAIFGGWMPWGLIAIFASLLTYGKATAIFVASDSDYDKDSEYEISGSWPKNLKNPD